MQRRKFLQCAKIQMRSRRSVNMVGAERAKRCKVKVPDWDSNSWTQKSILSECKDSKHDFKILCDYKKSLE